MTSTVAKSSPTVPDAPDVQKVSFPSKDAPIREVTVFCENKAEVTRVVTFSSPSQLGLHEVTVTDLPDRFRIDEESVRVKGSGHCTILYVSFSDEKRDSTDDLSAEEMEEMEEIRKTDKRHEEEIQRLSDEQKVLRLRIDRTRRMRELADSFAERVVVATTVGGSGSLPPMRSPNEPGPTVNEVGNALGWWSKTAEDTDLQIHRMELGDRDLMGKMQRIRSQLSCDLPMTRKKLQQRKDGAPKKPGRISVNVDVLELGPIELEVTYMIAGATWSPAYDIRVDIQTDIISCTYFGRVEQKTTEDWEGVTLRLSTAEPTIHGTPPRLGSKIVSIKVPCSEPDVDVRLKRKKKRQINEGSLKRRRESAFRDGSGRGRGGHALMRTTAASLSHHVGGAYGGGGHDDSSLPLAPPLPPPARDSVAHVEGGGANGGGGIGAVSFVIGQLAIIKSNGQKKRLTVGELELSAEVTHYIVPSKEPAAYLQAKATNNTEYLLLASDDVSIFFDNSFITKTSLNSVSPGESFQTFLGIDPAVKITVAPPRKTSKKRGIFSKWNYVTHSHSTSVSNTKKVPVTCVVIDAVPSSADDVIKVTLKQPQPGNVPESEAITDDVLVSAALEMFGGGGINVGSNSASGSASSSNVDVTKNGVAGVTKSSSNHLAWVGKILPQGEIQIPLEYVLEWPAGKDIEVSE